MYLMYVNLAGVTTTVIPATVTTPAAVDALRGCKAHSQRLSEPRSIGTSLTSARTTSTSIRSTVTSTGTVSSVTTGGLTGDYVKRLHARQFCGEEDVGSVSNTESNSRSSTRTLGSSTGSSASGTYLSTSNTSLSTSSIGLSTYSTGLSASNTELSASSTPISTGSSTRATSVTSQITSASLRTITVSLANSATNTAPTVTSTLVVSSGIPDEGLSVLYPRQSRRGDDDNDYDSGDDSDRRCSTGIQGSASSTSRSTTSTTLRSTRATGTGAIGTAVVGRISENSGLYRKENKNSKRSLNVCQLYVDNHNGYESRSDDNDDYNKIYTATQAHSSTHPHISMPNVLEIFYR